jgi:hypothetical protein
VDIAVNQLIALTAAFHRTHKLDLDDLAHPLNPKNPVNLHETSVPCYHIGTGLSAFYQANYLTLNMKEIKLRLPLISHEQLMSTFKPFVSKIVNFGNSRTRKALGIPSFRATPSKVILSEYPASSTSSSSDDRHNAKKATTNGNEMALGIINGSRDPAKFGSLGNTNRTWSDPPITCGELDVDCPNVIERTWGFLGGQNCPGWIGYLRCARDEMERRGKRAGECYVD